MNKSDQFEQSIRARMSMAEKIQSIEKETGFELKEEDFPKVLEKAAEYNDELKKKEKDKNVLKNSVEQDFSKGSVRNQKCPLCNAKLKNCVCGFLL